MGGKITRLKDHNEGNETINELVPSQGPTIPILPNEEQQVGPTIPEETPVEPFSPASLPGKIGRASCRERVLRLV